MQINAFSNQNNRPQFNGQINFSERKFLTRMIRSMGRDELATAERELNRASAQNKKSSLADKILTLISPQRKTVNQNTSQLDFKQTLCEKWDDSLSTLKTLVELKLPNQYTLKMLPSNITSNHLHFHLFEGTKYVFGLTTNINNPKFPVEMMEQAAIEIKNGRDPMKMSGYKHEWKKG